MTASKLFDGLREAGITVENSPGGLAIDGIVPRPLEATLAVIHTGVRAVVSRRRWFGYRSVVPGTGIGAGRPQEIDPKQLIPAGIDRLCVEGDRAWDCLPTSLIADHPELWQQPTAKKAKAA